MGASGKTIAVLMATPMISAGIKAALLNLLVAPIAPPAIAMPNAIGRWRMPIGKPLTSAVARWPKPQTRAPSVAPKRSATMKPAKESKAMLLAGSGLMNEPMTASAVKMAIRAIFTLGRLLKR